MWLFSNLPSLWLYDSLKGPDQQVQPKPAHSQPLPICQRPARWARNITDHRHFLLNWAASLRSSSTGCGRNTSSGRPDFSDTTSSFNWVRWGKKEEVKKKNYQSQAPCFHLQVSWEIHQGFPGSGRLLCTCFWSYVLDHQQLRCLHKQAASQYGLFYFAFSQRHLLVLFLLPHSRYEVWFITQAPSSSYSLSFHVLLGIPPSLSSSSTRDQPPHILLSLHLRDDLLGELRKLLPCFSWLHHLKVFYSFKLTIFSPSLLGFLLWDSLILAHPFPSHWVVHFLSHPSRLLWNDNSSWSLLKPCPPQIKCISYLPSSHLELSLSKSQHCLGTLFVPSVASLVVLGSLVLLIVT